MMDTPALSGSVAVGLLQHRPPVEKFLFGVPMTVSSVNLSQVWENVREAVKDDLSAPHKTWLDHTVPLLANDDGFVVGVPNKWTLDWLEERLSPQLNAALKQATGSDMAIRLVVNQAAAQDYEAAASGTAPAPREEELLQTALLQDEFEPKYTFDSFVVGESNAFARNAALAVAEQPGLKYNPLFLWGGPGLGKTHLLQAIGAYVARHFPHRKVTYVSSEQFTNDFVGSLRAKTTDSFRKKYRSVDVLLIDDVQFMERKDGVQEQFFNTFNELHNHRKAIVLASDRPPKDINMEERYRSRFAWGLQADIQPPNYVTRLAILQQFVESQQVVFDDDALTYIAERATPNIREMEGAIIRITAYCELLKKSSVDRLCAEQVTCDLFPDCSHRPISIAMIQREVCRYYNISPSEIIGSKRSHSIVFPRQIAMYLSRELTDLSLPKIGSEFGGRDHTTVMHAQDKIKKLMGSDREVFNQVQQLTNIIKQKG